MDLGVHTFSMSGAGPLGEVLRRCGIDDSNVISWSYTRNPTQKLCYQGKLIEYPRDIETLGVSREEFSRVMGAVVSMPQDEISALDSVSLMVWLSSLTSNQVLHNIFAYIAELYFIATIWQASAGEFIRSMQIQAQKRASGYPSGGCRVIPQAYLNVLTDNGGEVRTNAGVKRIIVEEQEATGVELESGEVLKGDIIISNVDPGQTFLKMVGEEHISGDFSDQVKNIKYTPGAYVMKFALKKVITREKFIMYIPCPDVTDYLHRLEEGEVPEKVNLMIPVISNFDPGTAPEGHQLIIAGSFPAIEPKWDAWRRAVLNSVKDVFPDIEDHVLFIEETHPGVVGQLMGEGGAVIGMSQTIDQIGEKRLKQQTPIKNLYQVGGEAGGWGIGTELAANSALELNEMIE